MSSFEFELPEIGDGVAEAEIMSWLVAEGAEIAEHDALVEVQTDKALVEITSPVSGTLRQHNAAVGDIVKPGQVIAHFALGSDTTPDDTTETGGTTGGATPAAPGTTSDAGGGTAGEGPATTPGPQASSPPRPGQRPRAAPTVRALARELGIDLSDVPATGPGGRVLREDVVTFRDHPSTDRDSTDPDDNQDQDVPPADAITAAVPASPEDGARRIPLRGLRRAIARQMTETLRTVPHVTGMIEIDVTDLQGVLNDLKPAADSEGVRLTWTAFFALATIQALQEFPQMNAALDDERDEIVQYDRIHLGVATATEQGLLVPVVRHADRLSLLELAHEIGRVSVAARERKATAAELSGSTFTITNYGAVGGWHGTPMVNAPEIGIVGFGSVEPRPAVVDGALAVRTTVALSHTVDHRLIDGAVNARFGAAIRRRLERPQLLMLGVNNGHG